MSDESQPVRVHVLEKVLESDWFNEQSEEQQELIEYFAGQRAEVVDHDEKETHLVLNLVAQDNRYLHIPNEFIEEID